MPLHPLINRLLYFDLKTKNDVVIHRLRCFIFSRPLLYFFARKEVCEVHSSAADEVTDDVDALTAWILSDAAEDVSHMLH